MASTYAPSLHCSRCGNGLFHCGLAGYPHWCGACDWRGPASEARTSEKAGS